MKTGHNIGQTDAEVKLGNLFLTIKLQSSFSEKLVEATWIIAFLTTISYIVKNCCF